MQPQCCTPGLCPAFLHAGESRECCFQLHCLLSLELAIQQKGEPVSVSRLGGLQNSPAPPRILV